MCTAANPRNPKRLVSRAEGQMYLGRREPRPLRLTFVTPNASLTPAGSHLFYVDASRVVSVSRLRERLRAAHYWTCILMRRMQARRYKACIASRGCEPVHVGLACYLIYIGAASAPRSIPTPSVHEVEHYASLIRAGSHPREAMRARRYRARIRLIEMQVQ